MKRILHVVCFVVLFINSGFAQNKIVDDRSKYNFNPEWVFTKGDIPEASSVSFDDSK